MARKPHNYGGSNPLAVHTINLEEWKVLQAKASHPLTMDGPFQQSRNSRVMQTRDDYTGSVRASDRY